MDRSEDTTRWKLMLFAAIACTAIAASVLSGSPTSERLPEIALGWQPLFHVERAGAMLGVLSAIILVGWRASRGELPTRFANVEYRLNETAVTSSSLEQRVWLLELINGLRPALDDDGEEA